MYDLRFQEENRNWTIRRQDYQEPADDYLLELADNLALSPISSTVELPILLLLSPE